MGDLPVFNSPKSTTIAPIQPFGIDSVRAAAENGTSIVIPIASEPAADIMMVLSDVKFIHKTPDGFHCFAVCRQFVTSPHGGDGIEASYQSVGRTNLCYINVSGQEVTLEYTTKVMVDQVTGIYTLEEGV